MTDQAPRGWASAVGLAAATVASLVFFAWPLGVWWSVRVRANLDGGPCPLPAPCPALVDISIAAGGWLTTGGVFFHPPFTLPCL